MVNTKKICLQLYDKEVFSYRGYLRITIGRILRESFTQGRICQHLIHNKENSLSDKTKITCDLDLQAFQDMLATK